MVSSKFYVKAVKPLLDIVFAFSLFILLFLPLVLVSVFVFIDIGKSPVFTQVRVGKNEQRFKIYKLRTMKQDENEQTMTGLGKLLRSTSIDELPQIINIIKGEMSFIGPRPLLVEYLPFYNNEEKKRHWVKPGITGWAQVNGRNDIEWEKRMILDIYYADNISFLLDLRIVFLTVYQLMKRDKTPYKKGSAIKFSEYASKR